MKKYIVFCLICLLSQLYATAQERIVIHNGGNVMYESLVTDIDSIKFHNTSSILHIADNTLEIPISEIDSITFTSEPVNPDDNVVYIMYNNDGVSVINPFEGQGVTVNFENNHVVVTATSGIENIEYRLSGNTEDGSFSISSNQSVTITLSNSGITNPSGAAVSITDNITSTIILAENTSNNLSDGSSGSQSATLMSAGPLIFNGTGSLNLKGYKKHGISSDYKINVQNGKITILQAVSDGFHSEEFTMDGGELDIASDSDGIDAGGGTVVINNGSIKITSTGDDVKGIKGDSDITINGGSIYMTVSGAQSKGLSGKKDVIFNGGSTNIITSGITVLESSGSGYDPSYCTAVKTKGNIMVNNGIINFESTSACDGGKGLSADEDITINNGTIIISTAGDGKTYTNEDGEPDSYTSCCIKSDGDMYILGGNITCTSTGKGGKGISSDGTLTIGILGVSDDNLILNTTTTGEQFYVSGSGDNADYASPKAIKSEGNLTVHSGTIVILCTQSGEGGEGLESKDILTINGGAIEISAYDDCINASNHIEITGGTIYCVSRGNDAVDSNGTLTISGGFIIAGGTRNPEGGFDCDQSRFAITGGIIIGTGGNTSNPTINATTQYVVKYSSATPGNAICIKNKTTSDVILLYQLPAYTGSSGGPGGGNNMTLLFSDPAFTTGSYTLQYGGTISGGTTVNGYNSGGTYSGGSSRDFTISSILTTIN